VIILSVKDNISKIYQNIRMFLEDKYELSNQTSGRLTSEQVMEIVIPVAKEKNLMFEQGELSVTPNEPFLLRSTENKKLRWRVCFSFSVNNQKHTGTGDAVLYSIDIDDETGGVLEIYGLGNSNQDRVNEE
jgi:hypothetical protein